MAHPSGLPPGHMPPPPSYSSQPQQVMRPQPLAQNPQPPSLMSMSSMPLSHPQQHPRPHPIPHPHQPQQQQSFGRPPGPGYSSHPPPLHQQQQPLHQQRQHHQQPQQQQQQMHRLPPPPTSSSSAPSASASAVSSVGVPTPGVAAPSSSAAIMSRPTNPSAHYSVVHHPPGGGGQIKKPLPKKPVKRNQVSEIVARLMYGFGDAQHPESAAIDAMQDIVFEVIAEVTREAAKHRLQQYEAVFAAGGGGGGAAAAAKKEASKKLTAEDIEWALRKYPELLAAAQIHKKAR